MKPRPFMLPIHLLAVSLLMCAPALAQDITATATAQAEAPAPLPKYALSKEKSSLKFIATQNNAPVEGKFEDFAAEISFDPDRVAESSIRVEVDVNSLVLADAQTRQTLMTADWLDAVGNPKAVFTSTKIDRIPQTNDYYAHGELALRGAKAPVVLNFNINYMDDKTVVASGNATLNRADFGVGQGEWASDGVVKHAVRVEFRVTANQIP